MRYVVIFLFFSANLCNWISEGAFFPCQLLPVHTAFNNASSLTTLIFCYTEHDIAEYLPDFPCADYHKAVGKVVSTAIRFRRSHFLIQEHKTLNILLQA